MFIIAVKQHRVHDTPLTRTRDLIVIAVQVRSLYTHKAEPATIKNLKRGVASMLMMQLKSGKMMEVKAVFQNCALLTVPFTRFRVQCIIELCSVQVWACPQPHAL